jgi:hypothetical protein
MGFRLTHQAKSPMHRVAFLGDPGSASSLLNRCEFENICAREAPDLRQVAPKQTVACHFDLKLTGA